jgi:signal transduction histidine kinase
MLDLLYFSLIFAGLIIFAVVFYLKRTASNFLRVLTEIIKMNELNEYDPVKFIDNLPPLINKLGIKDYSYYFFYLDTEYQKTAEHTKYSIKKFVYAQDFTVYVEISPGKLRWERSYLGRLLVETVFLLLKIDVNLHLRAANKALMEFSKINTFLSHDIKNLAQFINIMDHNLANASTEAEKDKLMGYLKSTAPSLRMRSDRVLYALAENGKDYLPEKDMLNPCDLARNIGNILNVDIKCTGEDIDVYSERKGLIIIFENIIKNYYDKSISEPGISLSMEVKDMGDTVSVTFTDNGSPVVNPEKIFEPFFSEKKGGLGIGLYHCRNIANNMNASLRAENTENGPAFTLNIRTTG